MSLVARRNLRRGVLLVPSLFTLGNLFCGFYALREAAGGGQGAFERAAFFIIVGIVLDVLDGRIARYAHATSPLGIQLDSLADVVSFGIAPALLAYAWALDGLDRIGWPIACVFASCGALRLARFNVLATSAQTDPRFFVGLPIPAAAGTVAAAVLLHPEPVASPAAALLLGGAVLALALLMVSRFRYRSFKQLDSAGRHPIRALLWALLGLSLLATHPRVFLAALGVAYALSAPAVRLLRLVRSRFDRRSEPHPAGP